MNTSTIVKAIVGVGVLLGVLAFFGLTPFGKSITTQLVGSPSGSSFTTSKVASQVVQVSTTTVYSQLNTDASSRVITGSDVFLTGASATNTVYAITCATSSTASGPGNGAASSILALTLSASNGAYYGTTTSPGAVYMASTSPGVTGTSTPFDYIPEQSYTQAARIWPSGTYLNCKNVTSVGSNSNLFDANITGTISFPYRGQ